MVRATILVLTLACCAMSTALASGDDIWREPMPGDPANIAVDGCETWMDSRSDASERKFNELQAAGYLGGIVIASNLTDQTDLGGSNRRIGAWLDAYCETHRWDTVEHALAGLAVDMAAAGLIK